MNAPKISAHKNMSKIAAKPRAPTAKPGAAPLKPADAVAAKYRAAGWTVINMRAGTCTDLVATCVGNVHFIQIGERMAGIFVQNAMSNGARPVRAVGASLIDANTGIRVVLRPGRSDTSAPKPSAIKPTGAKKAPLT